MLHGPVMSGGTPNRTSQKGALLPSFPNGFLALGAVGALLALKKVNMCSVTQRG